MGPRVGTTTQIAGRPNNIVLVREAPVGKQPQRRKGKPDKAGKRPPNKIYDARDGRLIPVILPQSNAYAVKGMNAFDLDTSVNNSLLCITNIGHSGTLCSYVQWAGAPVAPVPVNCATMTTSATAGGCTTMRAMKTTFSLVNTSQYVNRGGRAYVLRCPQKMVLPQATMSALNVAELGALKNVIAGHPNVETVDLANIPKDWSKTCLPRNGGLYEEFERNVGIDTADQFFSHVTIGSGGQTDDLPMDAFWIYIPVTTAGVVNELNVRVWSQWYTRWPADSILGQQMKPVPREGDKSTTTVPNRFG